MDIFGWYWREIICIDFLAGQGHLASFAGVLRFRDMRD